MRGNVKDIFTVFDGTDKELIIPVYQRNYDWGEKQCERLYDDLIEVIRKDRPKHFFGAVVGRPETGFAWVVIDGQQRLTTTSLLTLALSLVYLSTRCLQRGGGGWLSFDEVVDLADDVALEASDDVAFGLAFGCTPGSSA